MDIVIRAAVIFVVALVLTRALGRRELSSLEPFDVIMLVVLGDLIQQGVTQQDNSLTGTVLAVLTIGVLTVITAYLTFRSRRVRRVLDGEPIVLVQNGEPVAENLRRERITPAEVESEARLQQVPSLEDVRFAVLETNGRISVIPKS
jgi:uncharacterized membrane protein YcaP (DUF421 family)